MLPLIHFTIVATQCQGLYHGMNSLRDPLANNGAELAEDSIKCTFILPKIDKCIAMGRAALLLSFAWLKLDTSQNETHRIVKQSMKPGCIRGGIDQKNCFLYETT